MSKKTKQEGNNAEQHARRLLNECLQDEGEMLLVAKSKREMGTLIMGDHDMLSKVMAFLASKDPDFKALMLEAFKVFIVTSVQQVYGEEAVQRLNKYLNEEFPMPDIPWTNVQGEA